MFWSDLTLMGGEMWQMKVLTMTSDLFILISDEFVTVAAAAAWADRMSPWFSGDGMMEFKFCSCVRIQFSVCKTGLYLNHLYWAGHISGLWSCEMHTSFWSFEQALNKTWTCAQIKIILARINLFFFQCRTRRRLLRQVLQTQVWVRLQPHLLRTPSP